MAKRYLKGTFVFDCIAVFPYASTKPGLIFLRYLKLIKIGEYQNYFNNFVYECLINLIGKKTLHSIINIFSLVVLLCFTSHIFAVVWMLIGMYGYHKEVPEGWVKTTEDINLQENEYWSIYISSLYFVITSFSSIGYGDIKPYTKDEYVFILFMEMVGIGFFGYMLGTI